MIRNVHAVLSALAIVVSAGAAALAQTPPVLVLVDGLEADPTATQVSLVVRTTGAAALASGSLVVEAVDKEGGGAAAFASVLSATAFSTAGDATASALLDVPSQRLEIHFASPSATLNEAFGPLLRLDLELAPGLVEDQRFDLRVVPGLTELVAAGGELVPALADRGRLRLRPADPGEADLGPLGGEVAAGELAVFGAATGRPFAIGSGTIEILFDASVADGDPVLVVDSRYGSAEIDALAIEPGRVLVTFHSPDGDLNGMLYGLVFAVALPTRADLEVGTLADLSLGPATQLFDPLGAPLLVELDDTDVLDFVPEDLVLEAGFEEADLLEFTTAN